MGEAAASTEDVLIEVRDLKTHFPVPGGLLGRRRQVVKAVDGVSFAIRRGETFGLVGESGSGKTTLARTIMRLERHQAGQVMFEGEDILAASSSRMRPVRLSGTVYCHKAGLVA